MAMSFGSYTTVAEAGLGGGNPLTGALTMVAGRLYVLGIVIDDPTAAASIFLRRRR